MVVDADPRLFANLCVRAMTEDTRAVRALLDLPPHQRLLATNRRRYCRAGVVRRLIDAAHELRFSKPSEMVRIAELATALASRCLDVSQRERLDLCGSAWAELANAYKVRAAFRSSEKALAQSSLYFAQGSGLPHYRALHSEYLAALRLRQGRISEARMAISAALRDREGSTPRLVASALCQSSIVEHEAGNLIHALRLVTRATTLIDPLQDPRFALIPLHNGIRILVDLGRSSTALEAFERILPIYSRSADRLMLLRGKWLYSQILASFGRAETDSRAEVVYREAIEEAIQGELPYEAAKLALELALLFESRGRYSLLRDYVSEALAIFEAVGISREAMAARLLARAADDVLSARVQLTRALRRLDRHRRLL